MGKAENKIENYLKKRIEDAGGICWKISAVHAAGIPDRAVVLGRTVFVETKSPIGQLSKIQKLRRTQILNSGGEHYVTASKEAVDELVALLQSQWQKQKGRLNGSTEHENHSIHHNPVRTLRLCQEGNEPLGN